MRHRQHLVFLLVPLVLLPSVSLWAQGKAAIDSAPKRQITIVELDGGSVTTVLTTDVSLNAGSSLHRRWFVVNDSTCPAQIEDAGIRTEYKWGGRYGDGRYYYQAEGLLRPLKATSAYEVRFVLKDLWGGHVSTLSSTKIADTPAGAPVKLDTEWPALQESEVSMLQMVVAFIARVKRPDGSTWSFDQALISSRIVELRIELGEKDLIPEGRPK